MNTALPTTLRVAILADPVWSALEGAAGRGDGQAATWLPQFARALMESDVIELHWVSLSTRVSRMKRRTIGVHSFTELPHLFPSLDLLCGYRLARHRILRILKIINPDVMHCWGTERPYPALLGAGHWPGLLAMNGVLGEMERRGILPHGWRWRFKRRLEKKWLGNADIVTAESDWACDAVKRDFPDARTTKISYGVHPSFYEVQWSPSPSIPYVFYAGTINKGKGTDILIQALESLPARNWECHIAGNGPLMETLRARNTPGVRWLGSLDWKSLQAELAGAWCVVHPTLADSNPNVVKEARVVGLPIVTTLHGGQAEYLIHGGNSVVLEDFSADSLASALSQVMENLDSARGMGACGHKEDRHRFEPSNTMGAFVKLYQDLAKQYASTA